MDHISNRMLLNLDDPSLSDLANYFKNTLKMGTIPEKWKAADVRMIPKPSNPPYKPSANNSSCAKTRGTHHPQKSSILSGKYG
ncbi:hypothetical protein HPB48_022003 [Haemaphysalis longicornis]|uniref:Uncharacterized protein n=1 Tax=Haemaphysalis longicornis TaxID=44386 RepID=A0A9J6H5A2_HAELO|nr:hypothetical protein HPB48_022003 [Haemaphysalis longicornis]